MTLPLRVLGLWALALLILCAAALGIARWAGQQTATTDFPVPGADGCWQGLCLAQLSADEALAVLSDHPAVVPGSAARITAALSATSSVTLRFCLQPGGDAILLRLEPGSYTLQGDPPVQPLLALGALLRQIGAPARVNLLDNRRIALIYPERRLRAEVRPGASGAGGRVWLLPGDAVIALQAFDPPATPPESALYYPLFLPWTGYGAYGGVP